MIKYTERKVIEVFDWDKLVQDTYKKPYSFQQQDGCKSRGVYDFEIPNKWGVEDYENDTLPEVINGEEMGVSFKAWLEKDPESQLSPTDEELKNNSYYWGKSEEDATKWKKDKGHINMFWERNFYPSVDMIIEDLNKRGILEEGKYTINIDW